MFYDPTNEAKAIKRGLSKQQLSQLQAARGITNETVVELSESGLRSLLAKLDLPDRPRLRAEFRRLQEVDEKGQIPANALEAAFQELDSIRNHLVVQRSVAGVPCGPQATPTAMAAPPALMPGAGITPGVTNWQALGPGNIGGRIRALVIHPSHPDRIWAGSVGGGVWRTDDGGHSWTPVDDKMANLAVCCMVMDPTDSNRIYAGTGEGFFNLDAIRGAGIFHTADGATWSQLAATKQFHYVNRLAVSPNGRVLLAATGEGLFRSDDKDRMTWTKVLDGNIADVRFAHDDSRRAVAGGLRNGKAYYSGNGGKTWRAATATTPWNGRVELTYAAKDSSIVYASVQMHTGEIWRSTDEGKSYKRRKGNNENGAPAQYLGQQGWYDNAIWAGDPASSNLVVVGGIDLWRSTDGGNKLKRISQWNKDGSVHADHHVIVEHPSYDGSSNKTVFFGNDGGVYKTDDVKKAGNDADGTDRWTSLVNGFAVTQFYAGAGNASTGVIIGGAQDNGTLAYQPAAGVNGWKEILGGDGGFVAADPNDNKYFYGEYVYLEIYRNDDGAASSDNWWEKYINGRFWNAALGRWDWKPAPYHIPDSRTQNALFIAPFVLDPNDSNRILGGGLSLWRTNDAKTNNTSSKGPSWAAIKSSVGSEISAIAVAEGNADRVFVGHVNGEVYRSDDATQEAPHWTLVDDGLPGRYCTSITIDAKNHKTVYVTFGGYVSGNVWKSTNSGNDWTNIGAGLPNAPVRRLAVHPRKNKFLYLGTEVGLFTSEDGGATWSPTNEGPTNCAVYDLFWMNEELVTVTHGRGMFRIDLSSA